MLDVSKIVRFSDVKFSLDRVSDLAKHYEMIRRQTRELTVPLSIEDQVIQSMPDASPTRWHLAHTTWFFETFVLKAAFPEYRSLHPNYEMIFNSYYLGVGEPFTRSKRGILSRPTVAEVLSYREVVDQTILQGLRSGDHRLQPLLNVLELGLHHEQQHQELILTDIKHAFAQNPLSPVYQTHRPNRVRGKGPEVLNWISFEEGLVDVGWAGSGFSFDNERPRHRVFLESFCLATRPVSNLEYMEFMADEGYSKPEFWLSEGWQWVQAHAIQAPLYWFWQDDQWWSYTLSGVHPVDLDEPVVHVSYYEADAFARWAGCRLPREEEWEIAAQHQSIQGNFLESGCFHPQADGVFRTAKQCHQLFGDVWEWMQSPYVAYPGFRPFENAVGEYNGKFMCNQFVLRGGSCATPKSHIRATYRNFFYPHQRWQFMGIRLAKDGPARSGTC